MEIRLCVCGIIIGNNTKNLKSADNVKYNDGLLAVKYQLLIIMYILSTTIDFNDDCWPV
jgi:hypothetical protein